MKSLENRERKRHRLIGAAVVLCLVILAVFSGIRAHRISYSYDVQIQDGMRLVVAGLNGRCDAYQEAASVFAKAHRKKLFSKNAVFRSWFAGELGKLCGRNLTEEMDRERRILSVNSKDPQSLERLLLLRLASGDLQGAAELATALSELPDSSRRGKYYEKYIKELTELWDDKAPE